MQSRSEYFGHVLDDALEAAGLAPEALDGKGPDQLAPVLAALILSDSLNGLRKALLELAEATRRRS